MSNQKFVFWVVAFFLLAFIGGSWAIWASNTTKGDLLALAAIPKMDLITLLALVFAVYAADTLRYQVFGKAIGVRIGWNSALKASIANFFFSDITPGASLGAPGAVFMLGKSGIPWDAAAIVAFGKSLISIVFVLIFAFLSLALGIGPELPKYLKGIFAWGSFVILIFLLIPLGGAMAPKAFLEYCTKLRIWCENKPLFARKTFKSCLSCFFQVLQKMVERLALFQRAGLKALLAIFFSNFIYFTVFIGISVFLAQNFGSNSLIKAVGVSVVYVAFTYVAPTPGGAGIAEASSGVFFRGILSEKKAVLVVLLFRVITAYFQVLIGFIYLFFAGCIGEILQKKTAQIGGS